MSRVKVRIEPHNGERCQTPKMHQEINRELPRGIWRRLFRMEPVVVVDYRPIAREAYWTCECGAVWHWSPHLDLFSYPPRGAWRKSVDAPERWEFREI